MRTSYGFWNLLICAALTVAGGCDGPERAEVHSDDGEGPGRLLVLGLDGFDPDVVDQLVGEGRMPTFERLLAEGAFGRFESQPPLLSPILWTTLATGREPLDHGVTAFTVPGEDGRELPITSRERRVKALWNLWGEAGKESAVVGWWATWPAEAVDRGLVLSDRAGFHFLLAATGETDEDLPGLAYPPEAAEELMPLFREADDLSAEEVLAFADVDRETSAGDFRFGDDLSHLKWAIATADSYRRIGLEIWNTRRPENLMVYFEGADTVSHLFGHLHGRTDLAGELLEQQQRFGRTITAMYEYLDRVVGEFVAAMDESTTLVVVSDHGFALGEVLDDPSRARDLRRVSHESHEIEGVLYLFGHRVRPGARLEGAGLFDFAPTLLALGGLPASDEMPGRVLTEAFTSLAVPSRVATVEGVGERSAAGGPRDAAVDDAVLEKLEALGYIDRSDSDRSATLRNDGALALRAGRYREAAVAFHQLLREEPEDAGLHTALASALIGLGRIEQARTSVETALELAPDSAGAVFTLGRIHEEEGDREGAIASFQRALQYDAEHGPSSAALDRLGAPRVGRVASTPTERQAALLLRRAKDALERTDYEEAERAIDELEALVPDEAVVYHYRSNLCYLTGRYDCAIQALERGLELDPENGLFRQNLARLRDKVGRE